MSFVFSDVAFKICMLCKLDFLIHTNSVNNAIILSASFFWSWQREIKNLDTLTPCDLTIYFHETCQRLLRPDRVWKQSSFNPIQPSYTRKGI